MDAAWAYARTEGDAADVAASLPRLSGAAGVRLKLDRDGEPIGPPAGATRFRGVWHTGRARGEADVVVLPFSEWGCEVHVALRPPERFAGRLLRTPRHLRRLAGSLADAIAGATAQPPTFRHRVPSESDTAMRRWVLASAARSSEAR
jgi:hypothetical protein